MKNVLPKLFDPRPKSKDPVPVVKHSIGVLDINLVTVGDLPSFFGGMNNIVIFAAPTDKQVEDADGDVFAAILNSRNFYMITNIGKTE